MQKFWTDEEIKYLVDNHYFKTCEEISLDLGRGIRSVQHKFAKLGLDNHDLPVNYRINHLTILEVDKSFVGRGGERKVTVKCDCDRIRVKTLHLVKTGHIQTCGECYLRYEKASERMIQLNTTHGCGKRGSKLYERYRGMTQRCYNINNAKYISYGARGIRICDEWKNDPASFILWGENNGFDPKLSLDRLDENWHYCPENCRWTDDNGQLESKYNNRIVLAWMETKSILHWTRDNRCKTNIDVIKKRLAEGWSTEDAISKPADINT